MIPWGKIREEVEVAEKLGGLYKGQYLHVKEETSSEDWRFYAEIFVNGERVYFSGVTTYVAVMKWLKEEVEEKYSMSLEAFQKRLNSTEDPDSELHKIFFDIWKNGYGEGCDDNRGDSEAGEEKNPFSELIK